jgi:hypothetical protein
VRNLLRFAYAHVQMVLYRPFLHYISPRVTAGKTADERAYACGASGITVARNIVHIGQEMRKQVSLVGPYWFTLFTEFFAIISLIFYALENQDKPGTKEILADAVAGKDMISQLARTSLAAHRITDALGVSLSLSDIANDEVLGLTLRIHRRYSINCQTASGRANPVPSPRRSGQRLGRVLLVLFQGHLSRSMLLKHREVPTHGI